MQDVIGDDGMWWFDEPRRWIDHDDARGPGDPDLAIDEQRQSMFDPSLAVEQIGVSQEVVKVGCHHQRLYRTI